MNRHPFLRLAGACHRLLFAFLPFAGAVMLPLTCNAIAASLSLSQSSIANNYAGALTLTINGLDSAGESVVIKEYLDVNGSGTIDAGDLLIRQYTVRDGQVARIGGQQNLNVPGDDDGASNSTITTHFNYSGSGDIVHLIPGTHIFQVSPSGSGFAPVTQVLTVTQQDYAGSGISGQVVGSSVPQAYALVMVQTAGQDGNSVAMLLADASGNFAIKVAPGTYQLLAAKAGFVFNAGAAPTLTVPTGSFLTGQTETLTPSSRTISGTVMNATTSAGVPALGIQGGSQSGWVSITLADTNGNFVADATSEAWQLECDQGTAATFGLLTDKASEPGGVSNVTGFTYGLPQATALVYGSLKTPANAVVPFVEIDGQTNGSPAYKSQAVTDANGNYTLNAVIGAWQVDFQGSAYIVQGQNVTVGTAGTAVLQNLVANPVTAHIRGQVVDNHGNPVGNVQVNANYFDPSNPNGNSYGPVVTADANGNFDLGVFGGEGTATRAWTIGLNFGNTPLPYVPTTPTYNVQDGVDINGISYLVYDVTTHLYGQVLDENNNPVGNISMWGSLTPNGGVNAGVNVDSGGNFDLPLFGGNWNLGLSNIGGLGIIPQDFNITVTDHADQSGLVFHVIHAANTLSGILTGTGGAGLGGVSVYASCTAGGHTYSSVTTTDSGGHYSIPVFSSTWTVGVDANGLANLSYSPVSSQNVFVGSNPVVVNFAATAAGSYSISPSAGGNGAIFPNTVQSPGFNSVTFTATPNSGYIVNQWILDGNLVQTGGTTYAISNITANHNLQVTFLVPGQLSPSGWRQAWFGTTTNSGTAADTADPYHTGIKNLAVLAFLGPGQNPATARPNQLPAVQKIGGNLVFSFTQPAGTSGIHYGAQACTALNSWQAIPDTGSGTQHTYSVPMAGNPRLFLRLTLTEP